jgi:phosphatidate cytidylyltransferase
MSDNGTDSGWGAGSSAYARLRRLNDDEGAGDGFFDRVDDPPLAEESAPHEPRTKPAHGRAGKADKGKTKAEKGKAERGLFGRRKAAPAPERAEASESAGGTLPPTRPERTEAPERAARPGRTERSWDRAPAGPSRPSSADERSRGRIFDPPAVPDPADERFAPGYERTSSFEPTSSFERPSSFDPPAVPDPADERFAPGYERTSSYERTSGFDRPSSFDRPSGYEPASSGYEPASSGYEPASSGYEPASSSYDRLGSAFDRPSGYEQTGSGYGGTGSAYEGTDGIDVSRPHAPIEPPATERAAGPDPDADGGGGKRRRNAGRNVPASIAVGIALAGTVLGVLFYAKDYFIAVLVVAACVGVWELVRAIRNSGANPPAIPLMLGGTVMLGLAWFRGVEALSLGLLVTVLAVFVWRLADGPRGYQRDMGAAALITVYVPFLLGFAAPLATPDDGRWRILTTLAAVVLSDTGGFVAGVLFGKHPMAPTISPKKSWEGFAGSVVAAAIGGALLMWKLFDVAPWWGALFGAIVAVASVLGDLAESLLKRDLGIKDMSHLLPGHGGLMDRLDSILFALPTAYLLFELLAPPA